jgi:HEAT repeats
MQHTHSRHAPFQLDLPTLTHSKARLLRVALLLTAAALVAMLALPAASLAAEFIAPRQGTNPSALTNNAQNPFEERARQLAAVDTSQAFESLTQTLNASAPAAHRDVTIQLLKDASPQVVPVLLRALNDPDEGVRAGAAQVLGLRREYQAIAALETATHDPRARVRLQAATSLGEIYAWQDLPRLTELQVNEGNEDVRAAAHAADGAIKADIANEIGAPEVQVLAVSVTTFNAPQLYAATRSNLYARHGTTWEKVSRVPGRPLALVTGPDAQVLYLAAETSGLYRSADGGETWQPVALSGLNVPTQVTLTAIAVSPQDSARVYAALATPDATSHSLVGLGIATSSDGGKTWTWLPDAPTHVVTTRLLADPAAPGYLYGIADDTPWRYELASFNNLRPSASPLRQRTIA